MAEQMKPSGIDWIGDVPANWYMIKLKYFSYLKGRIGWQGLTADEFIDEGPYLITGTDFENGKIQFDRSYHISDERYNQAPEIQLKVGDLLVTKDGTVGKMAYVDMLPGKASLNSHLLLIRPLENKFDNRFLFWLMSSSVFSGYTEYAQDGTVMASLSQEKIGNFIAYFPEITEQQAIADFLDKECAQIDSIAADLEKQIELLQQYKKSLITEAVTKGLDKSVPMKDSGVEWLGKIPAHWDVKRFKDECSKIGDIDHYMPDSADEGIPYIMTGDFIGDENNIDFVNCKRISREDYIRLSKKMKPMYGDILLARYATIGTVRIVDIHEEFLVSYACAIIRIKESSYSKYIYYYLKSDTYFEEISQYIKTNTQANVGIDSIGRAKVPVPPIEEQEEISEFLDKKCHEINLVLRDKQKQLLTIQQHKNSLIYEYVTGKKRVKEVQ